MTAPFGFTTLPRYRGGGNNARANNNRNPIKPKRRVPTKNSDSDALRDGMQLPMRTKDWLSRSCTLLSWHQMILGLAYAIKSSILSLWTIKGSSLQDPALANSSFGGSIMTWFRKECRNSIAKSSLANSKCLNNRASSFASFPRVTEFKIWVTCSWLDRLMVSWICGIWECPDGNQAEKVSSPLKTAQD